VTGRWSSQGTPVSSTTKTDRHDITEILLKVASNTKIYPKSNSSLREVFGIYHSVAYCIIWSYLFQTLEKKPEEQSRIENPETRVSLSVRHRTKPNKKKPKTTLTIGNAYQYLDRFNIIILHTFRNDISSRFRKLNQFLFFFLTGKTTPTR
jgi:hypothetical protein